MSTVAVAPSLSSASSSAAAATAASSEASPCEAASEPPNIAFPSSEDNHDPSGSAITIRQDEGDEGEGSLGELSPRLPATVPAPSSSGTAANSNAESALSIKMRQQKELEEHAAAAAAASSSNSDPHPPPSPSPSSGSTADDHEAGDGSLYEYEHDRASIGTGTTRSPPGSPSSLSSWNSYVGGRRGDLADVEDLDLDECHPSAQPPLPSSSAANGNGNANRYTHWPHAHHHHHHHGHHHGHHHHHHDGQIHEPELETVNEREEEEAYIKRPIAKDAVVQESEEEEDASPSPSPEASRSASANASAEQTEDSDADQPHHQAHQHHPRQLTGLHLPSSLSALAAPAAATPTPSHFSTRGLGGLLGGYGARWSSRRRKSNSSGGTKEAPTSSAVSSPSWSSPSASGTSSPAAITEVTSSSSSSVVVAPDYGMMMTGPPALPPRSVSPSETIPAVPSRLCECVVAGEEVEEEEEEEVKEEDEDEVKKDGTIKASPQQPRSATAPSKAIFASSEAADEPMAEAKPIRSTSVESARTSTTARDRSCDSSSNTASTATLAGGARRLSEDLHADKEKEGEEDVSTAASVSPSTSPSRYQRPRPTTSGAASTSSCSSVSVSSSRSRGSSTSAATFTTDDMDGANDTDVTAPSSSSPHSSPPHSPVKHTAPLTRTGSMRKRPSSSSSSRNAAGTSTSASSTDAATAASAASSTAPTTSTEGRPRRASSASTQKKPLRPCFRRRSSAQPSSSASSSYGHPSYYHRDSSSERESYPRDSVRDDARLRASRPGGSSSGAGASPHVRFSQAPPEEVRTHSPVDYDRKSCPISSKLSPEDIEELKTMKMELGLLEAKWAAMHAVKVADSRENGTWGAGYASSSSAAHRRRATVDNSVEISFGHTPNHNPLAARARQRAEISRRLMDSRPTALFGTSPSSSGGMELPPYTASYSPASSPSHLSASPVNPFFRPVSPQVRAPSSPSGPKSFLLDVPPSPGHVAPLAGNGVVSAPASTSGKATPPSVPPTPPPLGEEHERERAMLGGMHCPVKLGRKAHAERVCLMSRFGLLDAPPPPLPGTQAKSGYMSTSAVPTFGGGAGAGGYRGVQRFSHNRFGAPNGMNSPVTPRATSPVSKDENPVSPTSTSSGDPSTPSAAESNSNKAGSSVHQRSASGNQRSSSAPPAGRSALAPVPPYPESESEDSSSSAAPARSSGDTPILAAAATQVAKERAREQEEEKKATPRGRSTVNKQVASSSASALPHAIAAAPVSPRSAVFGTHGSTTGKSPQKKPFSFTPAAAIESARRRSSVVSVASTASAASTAGTGTGTANDSLPTPLSSSSSTFSFSGLPPSGYDSPASEFYESGSEYDLLG